MRHDIFGRWDRRAFLKGCGALLSAPMLSTGAPPGFLAAASAQTRRASDRSEKLLASINPMIGTGWRGHMFPGAAAPFGLVQLSPDSSGAPDVQWNTQGDWYEWQHCSGYSYRDNIIDGFSHTHLQGTGGIDLGDVLLMPLVEGKNWFWDRGRVEALTEMQIEALGRESGIVFSPSEQGYRSFFSHGQEDARPGYYSVYLETPQVQAELTATTRCGMHRYRYSGKAGRRGLMVDLAHGLNCRAYVAELTIESSTRITGRRRTHGWARDREVCFALDLSNAFASAEIYVDGAVTPAQPGYYSGKEIKLILVLQPQPDELIVRVGISPVSVEGASRNLAAEITGWDFDAVVKQAGGAWTQALSALDAYIPDAATEMTFWSGAYHALVAPATYSDTDGSYRGQDQQNHNHPGFTKYTALSIWDIYRGEFPFLMLAQPGRVNDVIQTLLLDYQQLGQHALPMWPLWANETWSMIGFHAAGMILGAYIRGFRGFDVDAAYAAIRDTALVGAETRGNRELQAMFRQYGYVPCDLHSGSVSATLDLSYDYWCAGTFAKLLGKIDDSAMFLKLGQNYRHVYNPGTGFMQGKASDGTWHKPLIPNQETADYVETDPWQASFSVPHDVQGLIEMYGGDAAFTEKLDQLFSAPSLMLDARPDITGMVGQDAQGNEPSNHHPYLFAFAGAAWKTQYWSRKVAGLYRNTPAGVPGNDDCGQLSSWFVLAALGFYPVNAATGVYVLGSPIVDSAVLRNPLTGSRFSIVAENNSAQNVFIQRAELNGKELRRSWLTHEQITTDGELHLHMGASPNKEWAQAPADRPPSGLVGA